MAYYLHWLVNLVSKKAKNLSKERHITASTIRQTMMMSMRIRLSAFMSKPPIPVGIATISAAIITRHAIPDSNLSPVNILGIARGKTTVVKILVSDPLMFWPPG